MKRFDRMQPNFLATRNTKTKNISNEYIQYAYTVQRKRLLDIKFLLLKKCVRKSEKASSEALNTALDLLLKSFPVIRAI